MSYILDALQRAQAERGRGSVPGLHTPTAPTAATTASSAGPVRVAAWWLGASLAAACLAGAGWWLWRQPAQPAAPAAAAPQPVASAPVGRPAPEPVPSTPATPEPAPPAPSATVKPATPARRAPVPPVPAERRTANAPAAAQKAPAKAAPPAVEAAAPVFAQADLPPAVREQLPTLQLAGATYSSNPLYRMVIVNGQVLHEGDPAAPGLVLERIEPGRTVWAFRGYRYALPTQ